MRVDPPAAASAGPGARIPGDVEDRLHLWLGQNGRKTAQPSAQISMADDQDPQRRRLDHKRSTTHRNDHPGDGERSPESRTEQSGNPLSLVPGVPHVRLPLAVDDERSAADPQPGARVVLGIDGEHPAWADRDVINVRPAGADRDRVQELPSRIASCGGGKFAADQFLTLGADPPGAFIGVHIEDSTEHRSDRFLGPSPFPFRNCPSTRSLTRQIRDSRNRRTFRTFGPNARPAQGPNRHRSACEGCRSGRPSLHSLQRFSRRASGRDEPTARARAGCSEPCAQRCVRFVRHAARTQTHHSVAHPADPRFGQGSEPGRTTTMWTGRSRQDRARPRPRGGRGGQSHAHISPATGLRSGLALMVTLLLV